MLIFVLCWVKIWAKKNKKKDCGHTHADVMEFNYDIKPYGTRNQYQTTNFALPDIFQSFILLLFYSSLLLELFIMNLIPI